MIIISDICVATCNSIKMQGKQFLEDFFGSIAAKQAMI